MSLTEESGEALVPWRPLDSDCCGSGCNPCILDIYTQVLKGEKKERLPPQKWLLLLHYIHVTLSLEAEFYQIFRSYFKILVRLVVFYL